MPAGMRHFNSPEERAKREREGDKPTARAGGFRHFNSPEEVAKREAAAASGEPQRAPVAVPKRQGQRRAGVPATVPVTDWPPQGEPNNAPAPAAVIVPGPAPLQPGTTAQTGLAGRVAALEQLVHILIESPAEARELRAGLVNFQAVLESQRSLGNRLLALEKQADAIAEHLGLTGAEPAAEEEAPDGHGAVTPVEPVLEPAAGSEDPQPEGDQT